jgi:PIN domain nuclease of toxin-antitoxin system
MTPHLLDTCALLWWMSDAPELGRAARRTITNRRMSIVVSAATLWEIAVKRRKGRLSGVDEYLAGYAGWHQRWGFTAVAIEPDDAVAAGGLSIPHDDPFDRMIIVQAARLGARIVTCDDAIRRYVRDCVW